MNGSLTSIQWLEYIAHWDEVEISQGRNTRNRYEVSFAGMHVDGVSSEGDMGIVYEFNVQDASFRLVVKMSHTPTGLF